MDSVSIGLDIGSSAVRAAEIEIRDGRHILRRYAQVGLPAGFVVDGEVVHELGVAEALRRLWAEGGFSTNRVVLGVSGPRVFVRQAEVPAMNHDDLRSSLRFNAQEMVPISLDDAAFDFSVLSETKAESGRDAKMTVLLVAAHQDALRTYLTVLKLAGLSAVAMDSGALSLVRAAPVQAIPGEQTGLDVLVSVGADMTTVAVREGGVPRFIRSLTVGGSKLTSGIAESMHLEMAVAERLKRGAVPEMNPQLTQARRAMAQNIRDIAEDVRATVDFFTAQGDAERIERLLITGGASQTQGLAAAIGGDLPVEVYRMDPFATFDVAASGLTEEDLSRASATATTALGLALWPFESPLIRLSVLPEEVFRVQRARRLMRIGGVGVLGVAALLGFAGAGRYFQVHSERTAAHSAERQAAALATQVDQLQAKTAVHGQMLSRAGLDEHALKGDLDYVRVMGQLASVMPPNLHITSASFTRQQASGTGSAVSSSSTSGTASSVGTLTLSVTGTGDGHAAATWLDSLQNDPDLAGTWISGISISKSNGAETVSFNTNTNLTTTAQDNRAEDAKP